MRFGEFHLDLVDGGRERVSGEWVFGVVPPALWRKRFPPDPEGRVLLARHGLLVRGSGYTAFLAGAPGPFALEDAVRGEIDAVVYSDYPGEGDAAPFPGADVYVPADSAPGERRRPVDREVEVRPGLTVFPLQGHVRGSLGARIESDRRVALYLADGLPTAEHVPVVWLVAEERYPVELLQGKKALVDRAARERWLCVFWRDPDVPWGTIVDEAGGRRRVHVVPRDRTEL